VRVCLGDGEVWFCENEIVVVIARRDRVIYWQCASPSKISRVLAFNPFIKT